MKNNHLAQFFVAFVVVGVMATLGGSVFAEGVNHQAVAPAMQHQQTGVTTTTPAATTTTTIQQHDASAVTTEHHEAASKVAPEKQSQVGVVLQQHKAEASHK